MRTLNKIIKALLSEEICRRMPKYALQDIVAYKLAKAVEHKEYQEHIADNRLEEYNNIHRLH